MNTPKTPVQKFNLRLPMDLMEEAQAQAQAMGISFNSYMILALRNFVPYMARQLKSHTPTTVAAVMPQRSIPASTTRTAAKVGRNDACPCGSGRKAKHCHPEHC
ncbi:SEC-C domain-containing protein [Lysobacter sp. KIS68-7]|uniref:SEC-C metal-binding domain-containing protein n=1 Tax=Lysobacter sp. KIS68-7 TaxID=2904252 RepID=UPI001E591E47|nr:SEC-C metal-binding domain-containing protein [Lysobacter sp. KIS68-7]UHQ18944.1 SEC-C domain-containing protein [Lysobacter sp. KIS68-7]